MDLMDGKPPNPKGKGRVKYPLRTMGVDQYFFLPGRTRSNSFTSYLAHCAKRMGRKFVCRSLVMRLDEGKWIECQHADPGATSGVAVYRTE